MPQETKVTIVQLASILLLYNIGLQGIAPIIYNKSKWKISIVKSKVAFWHAFNLYDWKMIKTKALSSNKVVACIYTWKMMAKNTFLIIRILSLHMGSLYVA